MSFSQVANLLILAIFAFALAQVFEDGGFLSMMSALAFRVFFWSAVGILVHVLFLS